MSAVQLKVPYIDLGAQHRPILDELIERIRPVLASGQFILGEEVATFEKRFAQICGVKYALGVANGTDSLFLSLRALRIGPGDEVITAPNSYLASASSVALVGATPVFADVRQDYNIDPEQIRKRITSRTRAIIPVHLTGKPADMDAIMSIAREYNLAVIEDCAQAVGALYKGKPVGSFGNTGSFSLHPLKNLAAAGDGGVITTNDDALYEYLVRARNHGLRNRDECDFWSYNSRLDNLQAAMLNLKLDLLDSWNSRRRAIAAIYREKLHDVVWTPEYIADEVPVYHTFIIQADRRDALKQFLTEYGIDSKVHYPIPIHYQKAAEGLGYHKGDFPVTERQAETILSLPVFPELTNEQVHYVADTIRAFYGK